MSNHICNAALLLALSGAAGLPSRSAAALKVVATTEGLASLAREVGGERVEVTSLSRGIQDPHFVDANPTLAVKLRGADLLVDVGLDLEVGWLPPLVNQSRNADIQPGGGRRFTAGQAVAVLGAPAGPVDRSMGDLHPAGNPHFMSDPRRVAKVAEALSQRLAQLDPPGAAIYEKRLADFRARLSAAEARWAGALAPSKGKRVVTQHSSLDYFVDWAGLVSAGYLEPKPGTAPPPSHLAELIGVVKAQDVRAILVEAFYDLRSAEVVAKRTQARVVSIPGDVGGFKDERGAVEPKDWFSYMDTLVVLVSGALRA